MQTQPLKLYKPFKVCSLGSSRKKYSNAEKYRTARSSFAVQKKAISHFAPVPSFQTNRPRKVPRIQTDNDYKTIRVKLLTNWGNPENISMNGVSLLDSDKQIIDIDVAYSHPKNVPYLSKLFRSTNTTIMYSQDTTECKWNNWTVPFSPDKPIELVLMTLSDKPVHFVRFISANEDRAMNVRKVQIAEDNTVLWEGDIDSDIGAIIPINSTSERLKLTNYGKYIESPSSIKFKIMHSDKFGIIPQFSYKKISVELVENYGNHGTIGISHLIFYDCERKMIDKSYFKIRVKKGAVISSVDKCIFENPRKTQTIDNQVTFNIIEVQRPIIDIFLKQPVVIGGVFIFNPCIPDLPMDVGTKKIKLYLNDRLAWIGKVKMGSGEPVDQVASMTRVSLSDLNI